MKSIFENRTYLVTAGPTYEPIDPVRFIGNHSTGKMGFAIAEALAGRGARVHLIAGPVSLKTSHSGIIRHDVTTALQMHEACMSLFPQCDGAILSAAVADYRPMQQSDRKIKKTGSETLTLELVRNPDILAGLGNIKGSGQLLVGFSLETHDAEFFAQEKMIRKNCDMIVTNSLEEAGAGFGTDTNKVIILDRNGGRKVFGLKPKNEVAEDILDAMQSFAAAGNN